MRWTKIKALILAAGYATRLYPLTKDQPKPLLKVGGKPIIEHILEKIKEIDEINEIFIVTNARFYDHFKIWLNQNKLTPKVKIINDGTLNNEDRLGAVGDINYVIKEESVDDDLLVIAGDNLFGFKLTNLIDLHQQKGKKSVVAFHDLKSIEKIKGKYGVGQLDGSRIVGFQEKPLQPESSLAATACYLFNKEDLKLVERSIEQGYADNSGDLVRYLINKSEVHGFVFDEHWFDVGSFESLQEAEEVYKK